MTTFAQQLRAQGARVAYDQEFIRFGDLLAVKIEEAIRASASGILVFSPASAASNWVTNEYATMMKRSIESGLPFIPVLVEDGNLPPFAEARYYADFRGADTARQDKLVERGDYDQALDWYRKSLTIEERLGHRPSIAVVMSEIGALYVKTGRPAEAFAHSLRSLAIRVELRSPNVRTDLYWLSRQREALGEQEFQRLLAEHLNAGSIDVLLGWLAESVTD